MNPDFGGIGESVTDRGCEWEKDQKTSDLCAKKKSIPVRFTGVTKMSWKPEPFVRSESTGPKSLMHRDIPRISQDDKGYQLTMDKFNS